MAYRAGYPPPPSHPSPPPSPKRFRGTCMVTRQPKRFLLLQGATIVKKMNSRLKRIVRIRNTGATTGMQTETMSYSRIIGTEAVRTGRAGFGMPTFDHPVGGTCVAVGHPGFGTGTEPRGWGGSLFCQGPRLWRRVLRRASRICVVAGCFSCCSSGITRWSLRALSDGGSLLLRLR